MNHKGTKVTKATGHEVGLHIIFKFQSSNKASNDS